MRLALVSSLLVVGALLGASSPFAGVQASPVSTYKERANAICRTSTAFQLAQIRQLKPAAQKRDTHAVAVIYLAMIKDGYKTVKQITAMPVPIAARNEMTPIVRLLNRANLSIERAMKARDSAAFRTAILQSYAIGKRADPLLDAAGIVDCGSKQTRTIEMATTELARTPMSGQ